MEVKKVVEKCEECKGKGYFENDWGEHDCMHCDGQGRIIWAIYPDGRKEYRG